MDVSPKTLREVEFRQKTRGYHPEDVDHFLEEVAAGVEVLQNQMRQAVERARRAEAAATEAGGTDEALRKTLVLAQRTADLAVQEAREQAARILAGAEQQAQAMLVDAEERGRRTMEDTIAECRAELSRLETSRAQAQQDVDTLNRWLEEHKVHLQAALSDALAAVERAGVLWPAPSTRPAELAGGPLAGRPAPTPAPPPAPEPEEFGPDTAVWSAIDDEGLDAPPAPPGPTAESSPARPAPPAPPSPPAPAPSGGVTEATFTEVNDVPNDQAIDDFFDENDELADGRRFGSRLRRRH
jgi:cell division initiation protein